MKKAYKIIMWIIGSIITIVTIGLFLTYWWISTEWKDHYSKEELQEITFQINETDKLPENFYLAYDIVYPKQRNKTIKKRTVQTIWTLITKKYNKVRNYRECSSIAAIRYIHNQKIMGYHSLDSYILAHGLVNYTSEEKCFDYIYNQQTTNEFSYECFAKPLNDLTLNENIELLIRLEQPTYYKNNPDKLKERISEINKTNKQQKYKPN